MTPLEQALEAERLQLSLICSLVRLRDLLATDLLATASFTNGADPPYVQTKSTRNERRKRWFSGWRRRALKSARDHEKHLVERGRLHDSYRDTLKSLILDEAQVKELAFMHMRTIPTSDAVLLDRWPFQCTAFDEMLVNLGTIMEKAARTPKSSLSFFCCNTEATGAVGFHWMSAVFEVIAPGIGQGAAASGAQPHQRLREMKRRKTRRNQPVDQPVHLV